MALLTGHNLTRYFGADEILSGVSFELHRGECVAFVGPNGSGKSTLLDIIAGRLPPDDGDVHLARDVRVGYLPQVPDFNAEGTLWQAMEAVFSHLLDQAARLRELEQAMASGDGESMERYGRVLESFELAGGFTYEARIGQVLGGLGFRKDEFQTPVAHLSGGEKTRALLARLLLEEPDLLLLDEPTNHLDLEGIEWLEEQLQGWSGAIILVAHDRAFIDATAQRVWEMEGRHLESYRGNYTAYVQQREERRARQQAAYEAQQEHIEKTEEYVRRYMAGQRSAQAKGRLKRLERLERLERPQELERMSMELPAPIRSGDLVLGLYDLKAGYDDLPLVRVEEAEVRREQRVALVGPNGSGKTTLLRTILRRISPLEGRVRVGSAVRMGYFAQVQEHLDPRRTVLDALLEAGMVSVSETRSFLARYGFRGDDVFKEIGVLSGGERARVALAVLSLQKANFLLLDEPTNHLDLPSQEVLQEVISNFEGTVLMVSHDRYLIRELATHVWAIRDGELHLFKGYAPYAEWHRQEREGPAQPDDDEARRRWEEERQAERARRRAVDRRQRRLEELEGSIEELEGRMRTLSTALESAGRDQDVTRVTRLGQEYRQVEARMNDLLEEWAEVADAPVA
jgi:ATP-binding cassette subfamily F protein 3